jgi:hypothetical protein
MSDFGSRFSMSASSLVNSRPRQAVAAAVWRRPTPWLMTKLLAVTVRPSHQAQRVRSSEAGGRADELELPVLELLHAVVGKVSNQPSFPRHHGGQSNGTSPGFIPQIAASSAKCLTSAA